MLDSDLATLYQVETGALNRAVKRNEKRFPEDFRFQLTENEYSNLKCQSGISSLTKSGYGGRRTLPYVFMEQGISMLASVLHSDVAINTSISIMRVFVEMRHFIANNQFLFERISAVELNQLEYQKKTDEKFDEIFEYISDHEESQQKIFFDGQIYDAFSLLIDLVGSAKKSSLRFYATFLGTIAVKVEQVLCQHRCEGEDVEINEIRCDTCRQRIGI